LWQIQANTQSRALRPANPGCPAITSSKESALGEVPVCLFAKYGVSLRSETSVSASPSSAPCGGRRACRKPLRRRWSGKSIAPSPCAKCAILLLGKIWRTWKKSRNGDLIICHRERQISLLSSLLARLPYSIVFLFRMLVGLPGDPALPADFSRSLSWFCSLKIGMTQGQLAVNLV
jgi:hypothetical protein